MEEVARAQELRKAGYVYIIRAGDTRWHKIGCSDTHPHKRLLGLQCANHLPLTLVQVIRTPQRVQLEREIHRQLTERGFSRRGEWFEFPASYGQPA